MDPNETGEPGSVLPAMRLSADSWGNLMEIVLTIVVLLLSVACFFAAAFLAVGQLVWGIVDAAVSEHLSRGAKAAIILVTMFLLGPIMTFFYACFGTRSRGFRRATIASMIVFVVSGTGVIGLGAIHGATHDQLNSLLDRGQDMASTAGADTLKAGDLDLKIFRAVHYVPVSPRKWSVAVSDFQLTGPIPDTGMSVTVPSIYPLNQISVDPNTGRTYGITTHKFGYVVPATGHFVEIESDPSLPALSWPSALAVDGKHRRVIVVGRGAAFSYDPKTGAWENQPGFDDLGLISMVYDAEADVFYGLVSEFGRGHIESIVRIDRSGTVFGTIPLQHPLAADDLPAGRVQLLKPGSALVIMVSAHYRHAGANDQLIEQRLYVVDPDKGNIALVSS